MKKTINTKLIRSFNPCYDPNDIGMEDKEKLSIKEGIIKYRNLVRNKRDVIWIVCRKQFMTDRDLRLFAVWCAREALKLIDNPDFRSVNACNMAEAYANENITEKELTAAASAADAVAYDAAAASAASAAAYASAASAAAYASAASAYASAASAYAAAAYAAVAYASAASAYASAASAYAAAAYAAVAYASAYAAYAAGYADNIDKQIDQLLTYFE